MYFDLRRAIPCVVLVLLLAVAAPLSAGTGNQPFTRGDANADGTVDIGDAIFALAFLFTQGTTPICMDAADANDDGAVDIGDAIFTLGFLFTNGPPPPPPFPAPGVDPTSDAADTLICGDPCAPDELCNGLDDDCDGAIDEEPVDGLSWWPDLDGDTWGDATATPISACSAPPGHVATAGDCDDADLSVHPGGTEVCDGEDDDCDGDVDEGAVDGVPWYPDSDDDSYGDGSAMPVVACTAPPGHVASSDDCDDGDPGIFPTAAELCDDIDQDCDGVADDGLATSPWYADSDGDGYGAGPAVLDCAAPAGHVASSGDCDDADPAIHPDATELCDGVDQDCDGSASPPLLDDILEPARPPAAMSGGRGAEVLGMPVSIDLVDAGGNRAVYNAVCVPRLELTRDEIDVVLPGVGIDLIFQRRYRSRALGASGAMGHQWEHSYEIRAHFDADGLHLRTGDHREDVLLLQPDGVTYAKPGLLLTAHLSGVDIFVEFGDGGSWRLAPRGGGGGGGSGGWSIASIEDVHGNTLAFAYDAADRLATITDTVGRVVTLSYDPAGRIVALDDGTGRVWSYAYYLAGEPGGSPGDLKSVTTPAIVGTPTGNDFPLGRTTTYTYTSGHADDRLNHDLLTVIDPRGAARLVCAYDLDPTSATADALTFASDAGVDMADVFFTMQCEAPAPENNGATRRVVLNDDRGAVTELFCDALHRCVMRHEYTGFADPTSPTTATTNRPGPPLRPTDPLYFETRYDWSAEHRLTRVVHPNGNETQYVYEADLDPTAPFLTRTNLRQVVRTPGTHTPAGPYASLVESFVVAPGFGGYAGDQFRIASTDARGATTVTVRDAFGNALQVQHPIPGVVEDFEYDAQGRLTAHVRASHAALGLPPVRRRDEFTYHSAGPGAGLLATRVVDAGGLALTTAYEYDARGRVVHLIHPSGSDEFSERNALGELVVHLSRAFDSSGTRYETRCWYDANGNRVRVDLQNRDADGALVLANPFLTRIREYDARDRLARTVDEKGTFLVPPSQLDGAGLPASEFVTTEFEHDVAGRLLRVRSGQATNGAQPDAVVACQYDERNLLYRRVRGEGGLSVSTDQRDYDGNGNLVRLSTGLEAGARATVHVYDGQDRLVTETDPMGNVCTLEHDQNGNRTRLLLHGELADLPGSAGNVRLAEVEWGYDALDRCIARHSHRFDPATQAAISDGDNENWHFGGEDLITSHVDDSGDTTTVEYDSAERLHRVTDALGNQVEYTYDALSNLAAELHRDQSGVTPGLVVERTWSYAYDGLDRRISRTGPLGETMQWSHAWHGVARTIDERGNVRRAVADSLGRVLLVESDLTASGTGGAPVIATAVRQLQYDDNGRPVLRIDPNGNPTSYEYDALDRLVRTIRADATEETATWDAHGDLVSRVDANGTLRAHLYDALGRRIASSILAAPGVDPSATFESFVFDSTGRVRTAANDDAIVTRSFDSLGHLVSETVDGLTVEVATDDEGHGTNLVYPSGRQIAYAYDPLGRVALVAEGGALRAAIQYLGPSLVERRSTGDGVTTDYAYDASRRLVLISGSEGSGSSVVLQSYAWDAAGDLVSRLDQSPGSTLIAKSHAYDSLRRLILTQATSPFLPPSVRTYQFDPAGNRTTLGGTLPGGAYTMDPTLPEPADAQMNQYTQTPADLRQYTAAGELAVAIPVIPGPPETAYAYDGLGRLRSRQVGGLPPTEYAYDPFGRITQVVEGSSVRHYAHVDTLPVAVHDAGGTEIESTIFDPEWGHGMGASGFSIRRAGLLGIPEDHYLHADSSGSVVLLTGGAGDVIERYEYGDYGERTVRDAAGNVILDSQIGNEHGFHGHRHDPASGLVVVGERVFLEPGTGRMLSLDNDTGAIDFVRWGAVDVPPGADYCGANPSSRQRLLRFEIPERNLTPEQSQVLRIIAGKGNGDGDSFSRSFSWWGKCHDVARLEALDPGCDDKSLYCSGGVAHHEKWWESDLLTVEIDRALYPDAWVSHRPVVGNIDADPEPEAFGVSGRHRGGGELIIELSEATIGADRFRTPSTGHKYTGIRARRGVTGSKAFVDWVQKAANRVVVPQKIPLGGSVKGKKYNYFDGFPVRYVTAGSVTHATGNGQEAVSLQVEHYGLRSNLYPFTKN